MGSFQALTKKPNPPTGTDAPSTMSGMNLAPVAASAPDTATPSTDPDSALNEKIAAIRQKLNEKLAAIPDIDYEGKYRELLSKTQNRPVTPQGPNGLAAAAFALGSPKEAPQIMAERLQSHQSDVAAKQHEMLQLKEAMLHGDIQQQIQKGDFKRALAQQESMEDVQRQIAETERQKNLADFATRTNITNEAQMRLLQEKEAAALERARAYIAGRKDIAEKNKPEYARMYAQTFNSLMRPNPLTGVPDHTESEADDIARRTADAAFATQENLAPTGKPKEPAAAAGPAAAPAKGGYAAWKAAQEKSNK